MLIKVVLMVGIGAVALVLLRGYSGARHQAIRRLLLLAFTLLAGASLLAPQVWTAAAESLGVGRGTDLLLYLTIVAFLGYVATSYLRFRDLQAQITALSRRLALDEAPAPRTPLRVVPVDVVGPRTSPDGARADRTERPVRIVQR